MFRKKYDYLIALDSFKCSMTSLEVGQAVRSGIESINPDARVKVIPVADGGEGTVEALPYRRNVDTRTVKVTGPLGELGCSRIFVPQKGATPAMVKENAMANIERTWKLH